MVHLFRFTDAAYATAEQPETLRKFISDLHHFCLAMNHLRLDRPTCFFHHLIVARSTIAFGPVVEAHGRLPVEDRFLGVDATSLLIGKGSSTPTGFRSARPAISHLSPAIRVGQIKAPRLEERLVRRGASSSCWTAEDDFLSYDGAVDIPWLLLGPEQPTEAGLWAATYDDVLAKLRLLVKVNRPGIRGGSVPWK